MFRSEERPSLHSALADFEVCVQAGASCSPTRLRISTSKSPKSPLSPAVSRSVIVQPGFVLLRRSHRRSTDEKKKFPGKIVALSGGDSAVNAATANSVQAPVSKGLISSIMTAYNTHCELVISADDVWLTILSQFCAYVNKNAEGLRNRIVEHEGKKMLKAYSYGSLLTADYPRMIRDLLGQIRQNIKSPELADWFRPGFSTTTERDEVCAAATAMASLQAYFEYKMCLACGIPSVTLRGTVADWKLLREKIERLIDFEVEGNPEGKVMEQWVGYLRKVCDGFVESAERPDSAATLEFWDKVRRRGESRSYHAFGRYSLRPVSWSETYSGRCSPPNPWTRHPYRRTRSGSLAWISPDLRAPQYLMLSRINTRSTITHTVVLYCNSTWSSDSSCQVLSHERGRSGMPSYITGWVSAFACFNNDGDFVGKRKPEGAEFPKISDSDMCHNVVSVPVIIDDNGVEYDGTLFSGQVVCEAERGGERGYPVIHPRNDWCLAVAVKGTT